MNGKNFAVSLEIVDGVLLMTTSGIATNQFIQKTGEMVRAARKADEKTRLLIDVRELVISMSVLEIEGILDRMRDEKFHYNLRTALVYASETEHQDRKFQFVQTYAEILGIGLKVFTDFTKAEAWLNEYK